MVRCSGDGVTVSVAVHGFVEIRGLAHALAPVRRIAAVADDRQEPGALVPAPKSVRTSQRPDVRLLNDVFGVGGVAHQPSRQVVRRIEMRQQS